MTQYWHWFALVLPGGSLIALGIWWRRRWLAREAAAIAALINPPVQTFGKLPAKEYDAVRAEAARRHAAASNRQKQSAQIASGEPPEEAPLIQIAGYR